MNTEYIRERNKLTSTKLSEDGNPHETLVFDSINKAKKASKDMQKANGGLGCGYVRDFLSGYAPETTEVLKEAVKVLTEPTPEREVEAPIPPISAEQPQYAGDEVVFFSSRTSGRESASKIGTKLLDMGKDALKGRRWYIIL